ncbi:hypothetical protein [Cryptosporangium minutisporangium]|uniref:Uncharacterized protein n=1 Tax=Cryptosporangium minutisporangium TaxID=113569 RepID=A0ABP6SPY4_9ACTN
MSDAREGEPRAALRRRRNLKTVLVVLLALVLCGSCCVGCREVLIGDVIVADRPDLDSTAVKTARTNAETRLERNLSIARLPGTVVADAGQAACYPGEHSIKFSTPYDHLCISRHVVYLAITATSVRATLRTIHTALVNEDWSAQRPADRGGDRLTLNDESTHEPSTGPTALSLREAAYARDEDQLAFRYGPVSKDLLTTLTAWQDISLYAFTPAYWSERHRVTDADLGAAVRTSGGDVLIAVAAEQTWFRNGD